MKRNKVIIAGSREITDFQIVEFDIYKTLYEMKISDPIIVSGCASGVDRLGEEFAEKYGFEVKRFPAFWKKYGKGAGKMRNEKMAVFCSDDDTELGILIAFPLKGRSRGTWDMIHRAMKHNLEVYVFEKELPE